MNPVGSGEESLNVSDLERRQTAPRGSFPRCGLSEHPVLQKQRRNARRPGGGQCFQAVSTLHDRVLARNPRGSSISHPTEQGLEPVFGSIQSRIPAKLTPPTPVPGSHRGAFPQLRRKAALKTGLYFEFVGAAGLEPATLSLEG